MEFLMAKLFAIGRRYFLWSMALTLVAISGPVFAGPEDEVSAAMERWAATYATATNANAMVAFYAKDAVFWGTGSRQPFVGSDSFAPYFATQFDNYPSRSKVVFHDPIIRIYGGTFATSTGTYEFNVKTKDGQAVRQVLRFSFAYVKGGDQWLIVQQHSSQIP
jgi:uncharacterized protein (TIGR02246 family)